MMPSIMMMMMISREERNNSAMIKKKEFQFESEISQKALAFFLTLLFLFPFIRLLLTSLFLLRFLLQIFITPGIKKDLASQLSPLLQIQRGRSSLSTFCARRLQIDRVLRLCLFFSFLSFFFYSAAETTHDSNKPIGLPSERRE